MSYFPLKPRSACSSKDTAQLTCLQVHFVLFSNDLILAPVLCSAPNYFLNSSAYQIRNLVHLAEKCIVSLFILELDQFPNVVHWMDTKILCWPEHRAEGVRGCSGVRNGDQG